MKKPKVDLLSFTTHALVVSDCLVPHLELRVNADGTFEFLLDKRFKLEFSADTPRERINEIAAFMADTVAIAKGYAHHPSGEEPAQEITPFPYYVRA